jgi:hypothetical protein
MLLQVGHEILPSLQKAERHAALDALIRIRQSTWHDCGEVAELRPDYVRLQVY